MFTGLSIIASSRLYSEAFGGPLLLQEFHLALRFFYIQVVQRFEYFIVLLFSLQSHRVGVGDVELAFELLKGNDGESRVIVRCQFMVHTFLNHSNPQILSQSQDLIRSFEILI